MRKNRQMTRGLFILLLVLLSSATLLLYSLNSSSSKHILIDQTKQRQLAIVRSGALSIQLYIEGFKREIAALAQLQDMKNLSLPQARDMLVEAKNAEPTSLLLAYSRSDSQGITKIVVGKGSSEGTSVADKEYFQWAQKPENKGKILITSFLPNSSKSGKVLMLTTPCYSDSTFTGILTASIDLDLFDDIFVKPLSFVKEKDILIIADDGTIITGFFNGKDLDIGNFKSLINNNPNKEKYLRAFGNMITHEEGIIKLTFSTYNTGQAVMTKELFAYKRMHIGDRNWYLVYGNPLSVILASQNTPFSGYLTPIGIILLTLLLGYLFLTIERIEHSGGFIK